MELDHVTLNQFMLRELYPKTLINSHLKVHTPEADPHIIPHLGNNAKNILILVNEPDVPYLNDADLDSLTKILNRCNLTMGDVAIVNFGMKGSVSREILIERFAPKVMLMLGVEPAMLDMPLLFPHFQVQPYDGCTYLASPSFSQMAPDRDLKMQFWTSLRKIFNV